MVSGGIAIAVVICEMDVVDTTCTICITKFPEKIQLGIGMQGVKMVVAPRASIPAEFVVMVAAGIADGEFGAKREIGNGDDGAGGHIHEIDGGDGLRVVAMVDDLRMVVGERRKRLRRVEIDGDDLLVPEMETGGNTGEEGVGRGREKRRAMGVDAAFDALAQSVAR